MNIKRILVSTDLSECSLAAVRAAKDFAEDYDAKIVLCYALEAPAEVTLIGGSIRPMLDIDEETEKAAKALRDLAKKEGIDDAHLAGVAIKLHQPGVEIPECAVEQNCDMIVVATHGHTGFRHFILGSVTERIIRHSKIPVLVIPSKK